MGEAKNIYFTCLKSSIASAMASVYLTLLLLSFALISAIESVTNLDYFDGRPNRPSVESDATVSVSQPEEKAKPCTERLCQLPECFCSGIKVPKDLPAETIPQFVMPTFDDSINPNVAEFYDKLFKDRKNPNGCPIRGTFYVTHEWNDYWLTKKLYSEGREIADHSITHETTKAFKDADIDRWTKEICGMKKILEIFGQIRAEDVKGFRAPYLQPGGDDMFEAMARCGVTYDTSMPAAESDPPLWPHTLNYKSTQTCKIHPCPKNSHKGMWEVPMVYYHDQQNPPSHCAMIDACRDNGTKQSAYDLLLNNFLRHYLTNRAPFPMFMHAGWFTVNPYRWEALNDFIDTVLSQPDVFFVTATDVIEWIKNPVPCEDEVDENKQRTCRLNALKDWSCKSRSVRSRDPVCEKGQRQNCVLSRVVYNTTCERRFSTCFECPTSYPWLGNPDGNLYELLDEPIPAAERELWSPPRGIRLTKPKKAIKKEKVFNLDDSKRRLLDLLRRKLKDNNANRNILALVLGNNDKNDGS